MEITPPNFPRIELSMFIEILVMKILNSITKLHCRPKHTNITLAHPYSSRAFQQQVPRTWARALWFGSSQHNKTNKQTSLILLGLYQGLIRFCFFEIPHLKRGNIQLMKAACKPNHFFSASAFCQVLQSRLEWRSFSKRNWGQSWFSNNTFYLSRLVGEAHLPL